MTSEEYGQYIDDFELDVDVMPGESLTDYIERRRREFESDRKSTRLNSSHGYISYAVFCLKKKKTGGCKLYPDVLGVKGAEEGR